MEDRKGTDRRTFLGGLLKSSLALGFLGALGGIAAHLYLVVRQGLYAPTPEASGRELSRRMRPPRTYADLTLDGLIVGLLLFGALLTLAVLLPSEPGRPVAPLSPQGPRPPWYFLPVAAILRALPLGAGIAMLLALFLLLTAVPFLECARSPAGRWPVRVLGLLVLLLALWLGVREALGRESEASSDCSPDSRPRRLHLDPKGRQAGGSGWPAGRFTPSGAFSSCWACSTGSISSWACWARRSSRIISRTPSSGDTSTRRSRRSSSGPCPSSCCAICSWAPW